MFRNINNISIIPHTVYEQNMEEIEKHINILKYNNELKYSRAEKARARLELDKYKISIPYYSFYPRNNITIDINEFETLNIYKCNYDDKIGFTNVIEDDLDSTGNFF